MLRPLALATLLVTWFAGTMSGQQEPILVGWLNSWGVIAPLATYANGLWQRVEDPETFNQRNRSLDPELRNQWTLHVSGGGDRIIEGGPLIRFDDTYFLDWGLLTSFPVVSVDAHRRPFAIGPVVSPPRAITGVQRISPSYPIYVTMVESLKRSIGDWDTSPGFVVTKAWWIGLEGQGTDWIHVTAERWTGADASCRNVEVVSGWVRATGSTASLESFQRGTFDCDRKGELFMTPLGVLTLGSRAFLMAEIAGWESRDMDIIELSSNRVVSVLQP